MYPFENIGTVAEGMEEEQWDLICDIIVCPAVQKWKLHTSLCTYAVKKTFPFFFFC